MRIDTLYSNITGENKTYSVDLSKYQLLLFEVSWVGGPWCPGIIIKNSGHAQSVMLTSNSVFGYCTITAVNDSGFTFSNNGFGLQMYVYGLKL